MATLLSESVIGLVGEQTAIGDAIGLAVKRFDEKDESNNVLILLTDGQNTAGNITPEQAKTLAIEKGVKVYTIGVGADQMLIQSFAKGSATDQRPPAPRVRQGPIPQKDRGPTRQESV